MGRKRVNIKAILGDPDLRRKLMVSTIRATQAREDIETTEEQADRAYYVVSEGERATFFDLARFKGSKRGEDNRRHEMFVRSLRGDDKSARYDIPRRDFAAINGAPMAYSRIGYIAHLFREQPALEPAAAKATKGIATTADWIFVREFWELPTNYPGWVPFAKGGEYCRFYSDVHLRLLWRDDGAALYEYLEEKTSGSPTRWINAVSYYFRPGLTWPLRTQRGFNLRVLPAGCIFSHKGPSIFPKNYDDTWYILGVGNSALAEYILQSLTSFGSWEVGPVQKLPIPSPRSSDRERIGGIAKAIHAAKASWDEGNEVSTSFTIPWCLNEAIIDVESTGLFTKTLDFLRHYEDIEDARIRTLYAELNDEIYRRYGIPDTTQKIIEYTLGSRPPEVLWPQMEGKTVEQKRMEHVWRLLSYAVKRVLEEDDDGIVPFKAVNGEPRLLDRVRHELASLFHGRDANQVEVELVNELKRSVKGYRKCESLGDWLDNVFFDYHCGLYKNRPIFWHIASSQGTGPFAFGALAHYHRFDKNRMAKLRASYLRDAMEEFRREAGLADKTGRTDDKLEWQARLEETLVLDKKLQAIQEGRNEGPEGGDRDFRILTPWKSASERPKGWDPDIDDGVKVNIEPFQKAGVLRIAKVV